MSLLEHWPDLLTLQEAAEILRTDPATVGSFIQAGKITCTEIAGKSLIPRAFLEDFIEKSYRVCYNEGVEIRTPAPDPQGAAHLDNRIELDCAPQGEIEMAKITRTVILNGVKHWIRANTEQEYADKLLKLVGSQGTAQERGKHLFADYALNWFETYSKPNIATATVKLYSHLLIYHIIPAFEGMAVENIRVDDIQRLFNNMDTSKETKYKVKRLLNQVLNAAVDDEFLMKSPLKSDRIKITGAESTTTATYSVEQMQYLVQHIEDIKQPLDRTYMAIQALHPLRLEEVLGLKWSDIDLEHMALHVNRAVTHPTRNQPEVKDTKTKSSVRTIGLSQLTVSYLTPGKADEFVVGGNSPLSYTQVRRMCERIQKDTGFTEKITPKRFRTTVLTDLYDKTRDIKLVQAAAGHTTADMTLKHYVKGRGNVVKSAAAIESAYTA
ncbi:MAG: tyrosine-type recombinase/integrase [Oscillospiraceae bacterium]|nr:tyrosine-type recombinase/integrase [Oscillospiraceae bacterium]